METQDLEQLRYPIGKYEIPEPITENHLTEWIDILEHLPSRLEAMVTPLSEGQLETPYRPEGWTVRQLVHHISDSHHHSYIRFKWALTEDNPLIKPYLEKEWSKLFDAKTAPIQMSLDHLKAVHAKLVHLLKGLSTEELQRTFRHPEDNSQSTLAENVGRYAWHGSHHFAHIENLIKRKGW
ncbi:YfiT family bacillithiol transferase [Flagellimonas allohymeniacidonis]|uniref:Putative metal-dependent hydrolase n=1 Tax=Flagellimonas allohymeniacidonis TaxID=2517819 RepID=A0A4Q8QHZ3_9FLAO|nr:putative metal-dependent hydrolase [Allomuricauda hymeniacidonis]TAI49427.1 putative metal-dependent hydrolase [Allomuricauda hymeniacidonis]